MRFLSGFSGESGTTWPVIAEVTHLLDFSADKQAEFLEWLERGGVAVGENGTNDLGQVIALMKKYSDAPIDLGDATMELRRQATKKARCEALTPGSQVCSWANVGIAFEGRQVGHIESVGENTLQVQLSRRGRPCADFGQWGADSRRGGFGGQQD